MHVRVCVECGEEYRPEIAVCADCGGALEDRRDDIEQAGWAAYDLTTFRQPIDAIADHIMTLVTNPGAAGRSSFLAAPIWRRSVRPS